MARQYVASTPASRGEVVVDEDVDASLLPDGATREEVLEILEQVAAELGYELVPIVPAPQKPENEPARSGSTEAWVTYAKERGAQDSDLVDDKGDPLKRDALAEKFGTPFPPPA